MAEDTTSSFDQFNSPQFKLLLDQLWQATGDLETDAAWPEQQLEWMADAGVLGWIIPNEFGGTGVSAGELMIGYERLARACLVSTFVLTQRNGACQRIAGASNETLKAELLPPLARGEVFATVGISHLTTSRQHLKKPAVEVRREGDQFHFSGTVPWVTGATHADYIVTGGTTEDGDQVLAVIPLSTDGVTAREPVRLMALNASQTGPVELDNVVISKHYVISGPMHNVMKKGKGGGAGSLTTSALAIGAAESSLRHLKHEAASRPDLIEICEPLDHERLSILADLLDSARGGSDQQNPSHTAESIRQKANSLVLRTSQAYLAASKGAGFADGHPAGRAVREAMFFLVWSCPQPVLTAALREFACLVDG
jgi:alkylation response protein AidB-like acyl-CoA dehydrogenase